MLFNPTKLIEDDDLEAAGAMHQASARFRGSMATGHRVVGTTSDVKIGYTREMLAILNKAREQNREKPFLYAGYLASGIMIAGLQQRIAELEARLQVNGDTTD